MANNPRMKFTDWVNEKRGRSLAIAQTLDVSPPVVSDWATGKKGVPVARCAAIEAATCGEVTRKDLRPDDWQEIWPELAQAPANSEQAATETIAEQAPAIAAPVQTEPTAAPEPLRIGVQRRQGGRRERFSLVAPANSAQAATESVAKGAANV